MKNLILEIYQLIQDKSYIKSFQTLDPKIIKILFSNYIELNLIQKKNDFTQFLDWLKGVHPRLDNRYSTRGIRTHFINDKVVITGELPHLPTKIKTGEFYVPNEKAYALYYDCYKEYALQKERYTAAGTRYFFNQKSLNHEIIYPLGDEQKSYEHIDEIPKTLEQAGPNRRLWRSVEPYVEKLFDGLLWITRQVIKRELPAVLEQQFEKIVVETIEPAIRRTVWGAVNNFLENYFFEEIKEVDSRDVIINKSVVIDTIEEEEEDVVTFVEILPESFYDSAYVLDFGNKESKFDENLNPYNRDFVILPENNNRGPFSTEPKYLFGIMYKGDDDFLDPLVVWSLLIYLDFYSIPAFDSMLMESGITKGFSMSPDLYLNYLLGNNLIKWYNYSHLLLDVNGKWELQTKMIDGKEVFSWKWRKNASTFIPINPRTTTPTLKDLLENLIGPLEERDEDADDYNGDFKSVPYFVDQSIFNNIKSDAPNLLGSVRNSKLNPIRIRMDMPEELRRIILRNKFKYRPPYVWRHFPHHVHNVERVRIFFDTTARDIR